MLKPLRRYAGKDITAILADETSHIHSEAAYEILDDCHIGFLHTPAPVGGLLPPSPPGTPSSSSSSSGTASEVQSAEELSIPTDIAQDYKVHRFLDLSRPLFLQVWGGGFSKAFYLEQVHKPRHYKGGDSAPLFGNFLEPLSKTPWWLVPIIWGPLVGYGLWVANQGLPNPVWTASFWLLGCAIWTFLEYGLHRCLFHVDVLNPPPPQFGVRREVGMRWLTVVGSVCV